MRIIRALPTNIRAHSNGYSALLIKQPTVYLLDMCTNKLDNNANCTSKIRWDKISKRELPECSLGILRALTGLARHKKNVPY